MKHVYLLPGKIYIPRDGEEVSTNLGSCVSVVLSDPIADIAGLTHYVLPYPGEKQKPSPRFGSVAIHDLLSRLELAGAKSSRIQAHVYGGGNIFRGLAVTKDIGEQNIAVAFQILTKQGIPIVHQEVGGICARKITLSTRPFRVVSESTTPEKAADLDLSGFGAKHPPPEVTVAIVDDNENIRGLFKKIFTQNGLNVVGTAGNAHEARALIVEKKPMVVTLDIEMPKMSGVDFLKKLMEHFPTPVVMVSQLDAYGEEALQAMEYGAVEFVQKPLSFDQASLRAMAQSLVDKVRAAAFHVVASRRPRPLLGGVTPPERAEPTECQVIAIGGNIGSPAFLETFLKSVPVTSPPIVVADSTIGYFLGHYLRRLESSCKLGLHIASGGMTLERGNAYFIPKPYHGRISNKRGEFTLDLSEDSSLAKHSPSINVLFGSLASSVAKEGTAILLSSHGMDGISGLESVASAGGRILLQHPGETKFSQTVQHAVELGLFDSLVNSAELSSLLFPTMRKKAA